MPEGPLGNKRLTSAGPLAYDEDKPPEVPRGFEPPQEITNAKGDFIWYKNWQGEPLGSYGLTGLYDPAEDRMLVENRQLDGRGQVTYTHADMVIDLIEKSPFPKVPDVTVPAEAGGLGDSFSVEIPTAAGGAFVTTKRLDDDKEFIEKGDERATTEHFYKYVYTLAKIDFPGEAVVRMSHRINNRAGRFFVAERTFRLQDAYRELSFADMLPEPEVSPSGEV
jgi:hypothetical protein